VSVSSWFSATPTPTKTLIQLETMPARKQNLTRVWLDEWEHCVLNSEFNNLASCAPVRAADNSRWDMDCCFIGETLEWAVKKAISLSPQRLSMPTEKTCLLMSLLSAKICSWNLRRINIREGPSLGPRRSNWLTCLPPCWNEQFETTLLAVILCHLMENIV